MTSVRTAFLVGILLFALNAGADEPSLPMGLEAEPVLPTGLEMQNQEPYLPVGLDSVDEPAEKLPPAYSDENETDAPGWEILGFQVSGFAETRGGFRTQNDPSQKDVSIGEGRLQLQAERSLENLHVSFTGDFLYDDVTEKHSIDLERGEGWFGLREASVMYRLGHIADVKLGRQVLTWGTGDLVFINDMFPKDWNSFFIGRDEEYLKAPSDVLKVSFFNRFGNMDVVYTPRFDSDRFIDGRRISYFNQNVGAVVGRNVPVNVDSRDAWFEDDEIALRLYRNMGVFETALYGYWGYWKSPNGFQPNSNLFTFPKLNVYGASVRGPMLSGIVHLEAGYYDSQDDENGSDPLIRNSEFRLLLGYEQELLPELTGTFQYYLESMLDHDSYVQALPANSPRKDQNRHVLTLRLTQLLMNQNLTVSVFNFYSPSDSDGYLRPKINYKLTDAWQIEAGSNIFYGAHRHTFFGQFNDNSNLYVGLRYGF